MPKPPPTPNQVQLNFTGKSLKGERVTAMGVYVWIAENTYSYLGFIMVNDQIVYQIISPTADVDTTALSTNLMVALNVVP